MEADTTTTATNPGPGMPLSTVLGKGRLMDSLHSSASVEPTAVPPGLRGSFGHLQYTRKRNSPPQSKSEWKTAWKSFLGFQDMYDIIGDVRGNGPPGTDKRREGENTCSPEDQGNCQPLPWKKPFSQHLNRQRQHQVADAAGH